MAERKAVIPHCESCIHYSNNWCAYHQKPTTEFGDCADRNKPVPSLIKQIPTSSSPTASDMLRRAADLIDERGKTYDPKQNQERSMHKIVTLFNTLRGHNLTETDGWLFMQCLKLVRLTSAEGYHQDSYEDNIAYAALMAERAAK